MPSRPTDKAEPSALPFEKRNRLSLPFRSKRNSRDHPSMPSTRGEEDLPRGDEVPEILTPPGACVDALPNPSPPYKQNQSASVDNFLSQRKADLISSMFTRKPKKKSQTHQPVAEPQVAALEGESIAKRYSMGQAFISGDFYKIEYGLFKARPAVMIIVDLRLVYQSRNKINGMSIEFQFGKDESPSHQQPSLNTSDANLETTLPLHLESSNVPMISKCFAPDELAGATETVHVTKNSHINPKLEGASFRISGGGGGKREVTKHEYRWHVQGYEERRRAAVNETDEPYDTFRWNIVPNEISIDSVPRKIRLGMIPFHTHQPFWVDVKLEGSIQGHIGRKYRPGREKRWFHPPSAKEMGGHVLQEAVLTEVVGNANRNLVPVLGAMQQNNVLLIDTSVPGSEGGTGLAVMDGMTKLISEAGDTADDTGGGFVDDETASCVDTSTDTGGGFVDDGKASFVDTSTTI